MNDTLKKCFYCGEEILAIAIKCKHCGSALNDQIDAPTFKPLIDYGWLILAIPLISVMLIWFWLMHLSLMEGVAEKTNLLVVGTVLATALICATEAAKNRMKKLKDKDTYGPFGWFVLIIFLWFIAYPAYLLKRRHFGLPNLIWPSLIVTIIFLCSVVGLQSLIVNASSP